MSCAGLRTLGRMLFGEYRSIDACVARFSSGSSSFLSILSLFHPERRSRALLKSIHILQAGDDGLYVF
jgi:hypothetical protein